MPVDKNDPRYPEYIEECKRLFDASLEREDQILAEYPYWPGQDHPGDGRIKAEVVKRNQEFKRIKEKYGFGD